MAFADGATRRVAIIAEATAGTTPATPAFQILRTISAEGMINRPKVKSNERRSDGRTAQVYKGLAGVSAQLSVELSDDVGLDMLLSSLMSGAWAADVLKDARTPGPLTLEITDETGGTDSFQRLRGMHVSSLGLTLVPGQAIVANIGLIGMDGSYDTAIIAGATYTAAGTELVICGTDFTLTDFFGITSPQVARLTLNINAQMRQRHALNSSVAPYPMGIGLGQLEVSGEVECFCQDNTVVALDIGDTQNDLQFTAGVSANKKYSFDMLTCAVTGHKRADGGNNGDIMDTISFLALHDAGDASQLKITRNVA